MATILDTIAEATRVRVAEAKKTVPLEQIRSAARMLPADTGFPFEKALSAPGMSFICECKKASPSKGLIAPDFPYLEIAKSYEDAGASAISVLTEPQWFLGQNTYLQEIVQAVHIPCLRKDFTVDDYMIYEAKVLGASAVLLICSLLSEEQIRDSIKLCDSLGLSALVEAHDADEIEMALRAGARIIGVNNRNLKDFTITLETTRRLRPYVPEDKVFVAESGIMSDEDVEFLKACHMDAFLIGRAFMEAENPKELAKRWKGV